MRRFVSVLLIVGLLALTATGCGLIERVKDIAGDFIRNSDDPGGDPGDEPGDDLGDEPGDPGDDPGNLGNVILKGDIYFPWVVEDVFRSLSELGYVWTYITPSGSTSEWTFYYRIDGQEEIDGLNTDVVSVSANADEILECTLWLDASMTCLKAEANGEALDPEESGDSFYSFLAHYVNAVGLASAVIMVDGTYDSAHTLEGQSNESHALNNGSVAMKVFQFNEPDNDNDYIYGLTELGNEWVYIFLKRLYSDNSIDEFCLTHAVKR